MGGVKRSWSYFILISFHPTYDEKFIEEILNDPDLLHLRCGPDVKHEPMQFGYEYLAVTKDDKTVGLISYRFINDALMEVHMNILPDYWKKYVSLQVGLEFKQVLKSLPKLRKVITFIPDQARHAKLFTGRLGMKPESTLKDACMYQGQLQDLHIYSLNLHEDN
jgi:RimJ/RimL family protein N-acetyltransferase